MKCKHKIILVQSNPQSEMSIEQIDAALTIYEIMEESNKISDIQDIVSAEESDANEPEIEHTGRKLYVMRHGERIDFAFGSWIPFCFDEFGNYMRKDLNMPKNLPVRKNFPSGWKKDSPLTNIGCYQARLVGEGMKDKDVEFDYVFCSPSFRCVQTCTAVLEGLGIKDTHKICIEPGLFEWLAWYSEGVPDWCSKEELIKANYNINMDYKPFITEEQLDLEISENCDQFYGRNYQTADHIIKNTGDYKIFGF